MTGPATQLDLLDYLSSAGPFYDSTIIAKRSNSNYASALSWIEKELDLAHSESRPTKLLMTMPWEAQAFLLRLSIIRATIDEIATAINTESSWGNDSELVAKATTITNIFQLFAQAGGDAAKLERFGFDTKKQVTEPFPFLTSVWSKPSNTEQFSESLAVEELFMRHMSKESGVEKCVPREMPDYLVRRVEDCLGFLQSISEKLLHDISLNVRHLVMIDYERWPTMSDSEYREIGQSISSHLVPSCCFFSWHSLGKSEKLIEAIYHEALHKKLSNILVSTPILKDDYSTDEAPKFFSYWNRDTLWNPRHWEFDRALYAFHVYAHLVVFYGALLERTTNSEFPQEFAISQRGISVERAQALGDWLALNAEKCLTEKGVELIASLRNAVERSIEIAHTTH